MKYYFVCFYFIQNKTYKKDESKKFCLGYKFFKILRSLLFFFLNFYFQKNFNDRKKSILFFDELLDENYEFNHLINFFVGQNF